jgi:hypothetical protein
MTRAWNPAGAAGGTANIVQMKQRSWLFLLACTYCASQVAAQQPITMIGRRDYMLPGVPQSTVAADFNGDGRQDLAIADGRVTILLQEASGSFGTPISADSGNNPLFLAAGDFNHDGIQDLAVTALDGGSLSVLLGKGNGSFEAAVKYALPGAATGLAVADVNGDGNLDLLTISNVTSGVALSVLEGKGDGKFEPAITTITDTIAGGRNLQLADLTGSGTLDVVYVWGSQISVLLGLGNGSFGPVAHYQLGASPVGVVIADFNGDGIPDLVQVDSSEDSGSILIGNGNGTFQQPVYFYDVGVPGGIATADFNGDGKPDLAIYDWYDQQVLILEGNGNGTFTSLSSTRTDPQCCLILESPILAASLNIGQPADVMILNLYQSNASITVLTGLGNGFFETEGWVNSTIGAMETGDVNGDGKPDLVGTGLGELVTLLGNGNGTFEPAKDSPVAGSGNTLVLGQFNAGGTLDAATANYETAALDVVLGTGTGFFGHLQEAPLTESAGILLRADLNGDGKQDLIAGTYQTAYVLLGNGNGTFGNPITVNATGELIAVRDFNGDGIPDILLGGVPPDYELLVCLGNGDGTFGAPIVTSLPAAWAAVAEADFNGDGKLDLAVVFMAEYPQQNAPVVMLGNGDGTFGESLPFSLPDDVVPAMQVADFNGDGKPDLAVLLFNLCTVVLLPGDGQGGFGTATIYGVSGGRNEQMVVADFNGDGKPDLATTGGAGISILLQP